MAVTNKPCIVIYGGTFNPFHNGHLYPAIESAISVSAEKLIYLPCHIPPHKEQPDVSSFHRLQMTTVAVKGLNNGSLNIEVNDYEIQQNGASYTRNTIEHFYQKYPHHQLYFLIGMDSLLSFHSWYKWHEIFNYCHLLVMQRPGVTFIEQELHNQLQPYLADKIQFTHVQEVDISSTQVKRFYTEQGDNSPQFSLPLPKEVQEYITINELYK